MLIEDHFLNGINRPIENYVLGKSKKSDFTNIGNSAENILREINKND